MFYSASALQRGKLDLAKRPIEEKVKILVQLQKMAIPILSARDIKHKAWSI